MATDWGGILAGALGGAGQGVRELAGGYIEDSRKVDVAQQMSDINLKATKAAEAYRAQLGTQTKIDEATNPQLQGAILGNEEKRLRMQSGVAVDQAKAVGRADAELKTELGNMPAYLQALRNITNATDVGAALRALQVDQGRFELEKNKLVLNLQKDLSSAQATLVDSRDPDARVAAQATADRLQAVLGALTGQNTDDTKAKLAMAGLTALSNAQKKLADATTDEDRNSAHQDIARARQALDSAMRNQRPQVQPLDQQTAQSFAQIWKTATPEQRAIAVEKARQSFTSEDYTKLMQMVGGPAPAKGLVGGANPSLKPQAPNLATMSDDDIKAHVQQTLAGREKAAADKLAARQAAAPKLTIEQVQRMNPQQAQEALRWSDVLPADIQRELRKRT